MNSGGPMAQRGGDAHMQCGAQARVDKSTLEFSILAGCLLSPYDCTSVLARCATCCSRTVNMKRASCRCCYCVELGAILESMVVCSHGRTRVSVGRDLLRPSGRAAAGSEAPKKSRLRRGRGAMPGRCLFSGIDSELPHTMGFRPNARSRSKFGQFCIRCFAQVEVTKVRWLE